MTPDLFTHAATQEAVARHQDAIDALQAAQARMDTKGYHAGLKTVRNACTEVLEAEIEARRTK